MAEHEPDSSWVQDELEVSDLRPPRGGLDSTARIAGLHTRVWPRLTLALALVLLVAALLANLLSSRAALQGSSSLPVSPTSTDVPIPPTDTVSAALPPYPAPPLVAPTVLPGVLGVPHLGPAPASCGGKPPHLTTGGPPLSTSLAISSIGQAPILLGGFIGPYATLPLGPVAQTMAYTWTAPYTPYGWPAPIGLIILQSHITGRVTLSGWDVRTGYPLWFGFIVAGVWGAPQRVSPTFTLNLPNPSFPAGGWDTSETFWYGYAFVPGAGCYAIAVTWPGGSWQVTVSAGAVRL